MSFKSATENRSNVFLACTKTHAAHETPVKKIFLLIFARFLAHLELKTSRSFAIFKTREENLRHSPIALAQQKSFCRRRTDMDLTIAFVDFR